MNSRCEPPLTGNRGDHLGKGLFLRMDGDQPPVRNPAGDQNDGQQEGDAPQIELPSGQC